tara:strand:- start:65 stop:565 length:501 start_codon:yes stop_codon:yes gene_type:complete
MEIVLIIISLLLVILGIIGSFIPIIPSPISGWFGLLILNQVSFLEAQYYFLAITFAIAISVFILDYFIPSIGAKKFGGSNAGVIGSTIGLVIGIFLFGPIGIIFGSFFGALIGELTVNINNMRIALLAAIGTLIGYLGGVLLKLSVSLFFLVEFFKIVISNWNEII